MSQRLVREFLFCLVLLLPTLYRLSCLGPITAESSIAAPLGTAVLSVSPHTNPEELDVFLIRMLANPTDSTAVDDCNAGLSSRGGKIAAPFLRKKMVSFHCSLPRMWRRLVAIVVLRKPMLLEVKTTCCLTSIWKVAARQLFLTENEAC